VEHVLYGLTDEEIDQMLDVMAALASSIAALDIAPQEERSAEFVACRLEQCHELILDQIENEDRRRFFSAVLLFLIREIRRPPP